MNDQDRQAIDGLFAKLAEAERQAGPRDGEAEGFIAQRIAGQPAAPYLMAQTIVMQDYALQQAQARIQQLEQEAREAAPARTATGGGLFGGLFGSSQPPARRSPVPSMPRAGGPIPADASPAWQQGAQPGGAPMGGPGAAAQGGFGRPGFGGGGGGFLAGAAQTAMGVAGGVLLGNAIAGMFSGGEAKAAEAPADTPSELPVAATDEPADSGLDTGVDDVSAGDDGGFFGGGDWFGGGDEF